MRTLLILATVALGVTVCGCNPPPPKEVNLNPVKPTFPETADSPEKQAYMVVIRKKEDIDGRIKKMKDDHGAQTSEYNEKYPVIGSAMAFGEGPAPPVDPEVEKEQNEFKKKHGELRRKQGAEELEINKELIAFTADEYWPAVLTYAKFCHQRYLAEPNLANGGELFLIADELYENENLDEAYLYASELVKYGFESGDIFDLLVASAYCTDHLDVAKEYFDKAAMVGSTRRTSLVCVPAELEQAIQAWDVESKLREAEAAKDDLPRVKLETEVGDIVIELFEDQAPDTVGNFISLVESGYYDNTPFFAVVLTVAIYHGKSDKKLDYTIHSEADREGARFPFRGTLTMSPLGDGGNSVYGFSLRPSPHLHGNFTTFGRVVEGFDVFPQIAKYFTRNPMRGLEQTKVLKATVVRKRDHEYKPNKVEAEPATAAN